MVAGKCTDQALGQDCGFLLLLDAAPQLLIFTEAPEVVEVFPQNHLHQDPMPQCGAPGR